MPTDSRSSVNEGCALPELPCYVSAVVFRRLAALLCLVSLPAFAGKASELLATASESLKALKFEPAAHTANEGLLAGDATTDESAQLHFIIGQASAILGRTDEAVDAFGRALEIFPGLSLPPGVSPRIAGPFRTASEKLGTSRLVAVPRGRLLSDGRAQVEVTVEGDVFRLVDRGELSFFPAGEPRRLELSRTLPMMAAFPCRKTPCGYTVSLLDRSGNHVLEAGSTDSPLLVDASVLEARPVEPDTRAVDVTASRSWYAHPATWGIASGVFAAGSVVAGALFASSQARLLVIEGDKANHPFSDAQAANNERYTARTLMFTSMGVAVALAAVTAIVW